MESVAEIGGTRFSVQLPTTEALVLGVKDTSKLSTFLFAGSEVRP